MMDARVYTQAQMVEFLYTISPIHQKIELKYAVISCRWLDVMKDNDAGIGTCPGCGVSMPPIVVAHHQQSPGTSNLLQPLSEITRKRLLHMSQHSKL